METITQLLNEIEKYLQQLDHPCVEYLNSGWLFQIFGAKEKMFLWRNILQGQVI